MLDRPERSNGGGLRAGKGPRSKSSSGDKWQGSNVKTNGARANRTGGRNVGEKQTRARLNKSRDDDGVESLRGKANIVHAVRFHAEGGELDEMQPCGEILETMTSFQTTKSSHMGTCQHVCMYTLRTEEQENRRGCRGSLLAKGKLGNHYQRKI